MNISVNTISNFFTLTFSAIFLIIFVSIFIFALIDSTQTKHSLRRNYPVLARGRWIMEYVGHFFKYYLVNNEREERPFSKVERTYAYKAAKGNKRTEAFGSTLNRSEMSFSFVNSLFPYSGEQSSPKSITFGENTPNPYTSKSRINISGMSYGALSDVAVLSLSQGAKLGDFLMNTGEGGLSQFHIDGGAPIIFQIGTAKYGCSKDDLSLDEEKLKKLASKDQIKMFEIKLSQGAKPGKGGILPANKVTKEISLAREIPIGQASISPNTHVEITNTSTLVDFICKVKSITQKPTGIKLCLGSPEQIDDILIAIKDKMNKDEENQHLYYPDFITLDSADGGTGAAPLAHMDVMGMFIQESLPIVVDALHRYNLKNNIKIIASGKLITPSSAAWAFANGADSINIARGFLFSLGCIQARVCNKNKCPTGITTHDKKYTKGLVPENKSVRVFQYHENLTKDLMDIAHSCGVESFECLNTKHIRTFNNTINIKNIN